MPPRRAATTTATNPQVTQVDTPINDIPINATPEVLLTVLHTLASLPKQFQHVVFHALNEYVATRQQLQLLVLFPDFYNRHCALYFQHNNDNNNEDRDFIEDLQYNFPYLWRQILLANYHLYEQDENPPVQIAAQYDALLPSIQDGKLFSHDVPIFDPVKAFGEHPFYPQVDKAVTTLFRTQAANLNRHVVETIGNNNTDTFHTAFWDSLQNLFWKQRHIKPSTTATTRSQFTFSAIYNKISKKSINKKSQQQQYQQHDLRQRCGHNIEPFVASLVILKTAHDVQHAEQLKTTNHITTTIQHQYEWSTLPQNDTNNIDQAIRLYNNPNENLNDYPNLKRNLRQIAAYYTKVIKINLTKIVSYLALCYDMMYTREIYCILDDLHNNDDARQQQHALFWALQSKNQSQSALLFGMLPVDHLPGLESLLNHVIIPQNNNLNNNNIVQQQIPDYLLFSQQQQQNQHSNPIDVLDDVELELYNELQYLTTYNQLFTPTSASPNANNNNNNNDISNGDVLIDDVLTSLSHNVANLVLVGNQYTTSHPNFSTNHHHHSAKRGSNHLPPTESQLTQDLPWYSAAGDTLWYRDGDILDCCADGNNNNSNNNNGPLNTNTHDIDDFGCVLDEIELYCITGEVVQDQQLLLHLNNEYTSTLNQHINSQQQNQQNQPCLPNSISPYQQQNKNSNTNTDSKNKMGEEQEQTQTATTTTTTTIVTTPSPSVGLVYDQYYQTFYPPVPVLIQDPQDIIPTTTGTTKHQNNPNGDDNVEQNVDSPTAGGNTNNTKGMKKKRSTQRRLTIHNFTLDYVHYCKRIIVKMWEELVFKYLNPTNSITTAQKLRLLLASGGNGNVGLGDNDEETNKLKKILTTTPPIITILLYYLNHAQFNNNTVHESGSSGAADGTNNNNYHFALHNQFQKSITLLNNTFGSKQFIPEWWTTHIGTHPLPVPSGGYEKSHLQLNLESTTTKTVYTPKIKNLQKQIKNNIDISHINNNQQHGGRGGHYQHQQQQNPLYYNATLIDNKYTQELMGYYQLGLLSCYDDQMAHNDGYQTNSINDGNNNNSINSDNNHVVNIQPNIKFMTNLYDLHLIPTDYPSIPFNTINTSEPILKCIDFEGGDAELDYVDAIYKNNNQNDKFIPVHYKKTVPPFSQIQVTKQNEHNNINNKAPSLITSKLPFVVVLKHNKYPLMPHYIINNHNNNHINTTTSLLLPTRQYYHNNIIGIYHANYQIVLEHLSYTIYYYLYKHYNKLFGINYPAQQTDLREFLKQHQQQINNNDNTLLYHPQPDFFPLYAFYNNSVEFHGFAKQLTLFKRLYNQQQLINKENQKQRKQQQFDITTTTTTTTTPTTINNNTSIFNPQQFKDFWARLLNMINKLYCFYPDTNVIIINKKRPDEDDDQDEDNEIDENDNINDNTILLQSQQRWGSPLMKLTAGFMLTTTQQHYYTNTSQYNDFILNTLLYSPPAQQYENNKLFYTKSQMYVNIMVKQQQLYFFYLKLFIMNKIKSLWYYQVQQYKVLYTTPSASTELMSFNFTSPLVQFLTTLLPLGLSSTATTNQHNIAQYIMYAFQQHITYNTILPPILPSVMNNQQEQEQQSDFDNIFQIKDNTNKNNNNDGDDDQLINDKTNNKRARRQKPIPASVVAGINSTVMQDNDNYYDDSENPLVQLAKD